MPSIEEILENSDKGLVLEKLADTLESEGHKIVIIIGKPKADSADLDMEVIQFGFKYRFEELGFIQEGHNVVEDDDE